MSSRRTFAAALAAGIVGMAAADAPAAATTTKVPLIVPEPVQVGETALCSIPEWEYAPRWQIPPGGYHTATMADCAKDCEADPICTGATFIEYKNAKDKTNCYFKAWAQPNEPAATPCYAGPKKSKTFHALMRLNANSCASVVFADPPMKCGKEFKLYPESGESSAPYIAAGGAAASVPAIAPSVAPAVVPEAVATAAAPAIVVGDMYTVDGVTYEGFPGMDYFGADRAVTTVDTGTGLVAADAVECIAACNALKAGGCNAVSFYGGLAETEWYAGKNCYPKMIDSACLPADPMLENDARMLFMVTEECVGGMTPGMAPAAAMVLAAAVPVGGPAAAPAVAPAAGPAATPESTVVGGAIEEESDGEVADSISEEESDGDVADSISEGESDGDVADSVLEDEESTRGGVDGAVTDTLSAANMAGATAAAAIFGAVVLLL